MRAALLLLAGCCIGPAPAATGWCLEADGTHCSPAEFGQVCYSLLHGVQCVDCGTGDGIWLPYGSTCN